MRINRKIAILAMTTMLAGAAHAADLPTFKLEMNDGKVNPARIEVPAGQRIKIEVRNTGKGAAEFESVQLRKEKVLAPGADSFVVIAPLEPGEYAVVEYSPALDQGSLTLQVYDFSVHPKAK